MIFEPLNTQRQRLKSQIQKQEAFMTTVVHCKKARYDVYIGRPSKWGNPFNIGIDGTRKDVIRKYRDYVLQNNALMAALPELKDKILGCWCKPLECHGDVLAALANGLK